MIGTTSLSRAVCDTHDVSKGSEVHGAGVGVGISYQPPSPYQCTSVPVFQCTSVSVYQCTSVPVCQCSSLYQCTSVPVCQCSSYVPVYQCTRVPVFQFVPVYQCTRVPVFQFVPVYQCTSALHILMPIFSKNMGRKFISNTQCHESWTPIWHFSVLSPLINCFRRNFQTFLTIKTGFIHCWAERFLIFLPISGSAAFFLF